MEQSYPLKPYPTHVSADTIYGDRAPPDWSQYSDRGPPHWTSPAAFHRGPGGQRHAYEPLADSYVGYEPPPSHVAHEYPPQVTYDKPSQYFLVWWLPEIVSSFIAVSSLVAIIVVLRTYNGRSLGDVDLPASLTLNGVIAAISTILRVTLMVAVGSALSQEAWIWFSSNAHRQQQCESRLKDLDLSDAASRGAWGSLLFLLFARKRWLAYVGALVTILSLAIGTFTQQLLSIDQFPVGSRDLGLLPGNLPRAETWQYYNANPAELALTPPLSIRAAIYNGILSNKIDPITVHCPTGNCTWPTTPSLAVCGGCSPSSYTQKCDQNVCNYTMSSGANYSLTNNRDEGIGFIVESNRGGQTYNASSGDRLYLVNFDVLGAPYKVVAGAFNNQNVTSSECALWMCIQSYDTRVVAGQLYQNVTMTSANLTKPSTTQIGPFDNYTFANLPATMNPDPEVTYNVSYIGVTSFDDYLYGMFNGTAFLDTESSAADSDTVDAIWNSSANLSPWIAMVATSMSNAIRYDDPNPSPPSRQTLVPAPPRALYNGTGYQLGIRVRWAWLIMPAACVVLSILFLVAVMVKTAYSPVAPWKGSVLTFLFIGVDHDLTQRAATRMNQWRGVADAVGTNKAILKQDNEGKWMLKSA